MKPVTAWYRKIHNTQRYEYDHIQDGHIVAPYPKGTPEQNKAWSVLEWRREHKHLLKGRLI